MMRFKKDEVFIPRIKVMGVGGGGCNVINSMIRLGQMDSIELVAVNTDRQHLELCQAGEKIQIGRELCRGLGAGADPEVGRRAALENIDDIRESIDQCDILFLMGGFGGGTGTGALPAIAELAREKNILTIAVVSKPFGFEGNTRLERADRGLEVLRRTLDTIICINNDRLFEIVGENTPVTQAFAVVDNILCEGVRSIASLMSRPGYINVDFADMRSVMREKGRAILSFGEGSGKGKAVNAIEAALTSPFIEWHDISGARGILVNFTGGNDLTLFEINEALKALKRISAPDANIIFGTVIDETLQDHAYVTILITGLPNDMFESSMFQGPGTGAVETEPQGLAAAAPAAVPVPAKDPRAHRVHEEVPVEQAVMDFKPQNRGVFESVDPTVYDGNDLDIPPFMRGQMAAHAGE